jgi:hypothetical protein
MEDDTTLPVTLDLLGCSSQLFSEVSKKYIGIIESGVAKILRQLVGEFSLTLTANLIPGKRKSEPKGDRENHRLHMILYGCHSVGDQIGALLADKGLYLQHPHDYDPSVDYVNPQYLLRPGASLKIQECEKIGTPSKTALIKDILENNLKSQVLEVFDCAHGPQNFAEVKPSERLVTPLKT